MIRQGFLYKQKGPDDRPKPQVFRLMFQAVAVDLEMTVNRTRQPVGAFEHRHKRNSGFFGLHEPKLALRNSKALLHQLVISDGWGQLIWPPLAKAYQDRDEAGGQCQVQEDQVRKVQRDYERTLNNMYEQGVRGDDTVWQCWKEVWSQGFQGWTCNTLLATPKASGPPSETGYAANNRSESDYEAGRLTEPIVRPPIKGRDVKMKPITVAIMIVLAGFSSPVLAAMANPSGPKNATYVIVGTIVGVYENIRTSGSFIVNNRVAAIRVRQIERGEGLKNGDLLYAHYGTVGLPAGATPVPYDPGYQGRIPKDGETLRVYLTRQPHKRYGNLEGAFMVAQKGGFERLKEEKKP